MNPAFSAQEEAFRAEVVAFLADYRDLDAFFLQGHRWPRVKAFFAAIKVSPDPTSIELAPRDGPTLRSRFRVAVLGKDAER